MKLANEITIQHKSNVENLNKKKIPKKKMFRNMQRSYMRWCSRLKKTFDLKKKKIEVKRL